MSKILIVEDERIVAQDIARSLEALGHEVTGKAASCAEALALAEARPPDLVVMDIKIQGQPDGISTAAQLHQRFDTAVVYLTAYADAETVARAKVTRPLGYLAKPHSDAALRSTIESALNRRAREVPRPQPAREVPRPQPAPDQGDELAYFVALVTANLVHVTMELRKVAAHLTHLPGAQDSAARCRELIRNLEDALQGAGRVARAPGSSRVRESAPAGPGQPAGVRGRVLVIDSEPESLKTLVRTLGSSHEVKALAGTRPALAALRSGESWDLILCELMIPDLSGIEFYHRAVTQDPKIANRIVFLTRPPLVRQAQDFLDQVKNPTLAKPVSPQAAHELVQQLLESQQRAR